MDCTVYGILQNTGVGCHALLQGIFPSQESNPGFLHCRQILYQLSHQGSPRVLERVAVPFSRGSSQPRDRTWVSCIGRRILYRWVTREALNILSTNPFNPHSPISQMGENEAGEPSADQGCRHSPSASRSARNTAPPDPGTPRTGLCTLLPCARTDSP